MAMITIRNDLDQIEDHLYLGNAEAANNLEVLKTMDIQYVLSVLDSDFDHKSPSITYMKIAVHDFPDEDLLTRFPEAIEFIDNGLKSGHSVLVHCFAGVSRSATVLIAYLMAKHRKPYNVVRDEVRKKRLIGPNYGFVYQLKLFEQLDYTLDANNRQFRNYLIHPSFKHWTTIFVWTNHVGHYFAQLDKAEKMTQTLNLGLEYQCLKCDYKLFNEIHIINNKLQSNESCGYLYIEPQEWMKELLLKEVYIEDNNDILVPIKCPQCSQELVHYKPIFASFGDKCCAQHMSLKNCMRFRVQQNLVKIKSTI